VINLNGLATAPSITCKILSQYLNGMTEENHIQHIRAPSRN